MWQKNQIFVLFQLINLVHQMEAGKFSEPLTEKEMKDDFEFECKTRTTSELNLFAANLAKKTPSVKFAQPCKHCKLLNVKFSQRDSTPAKYNATNDGDDFDTILPINISYYQEECTCFFNVSAQAVEDSFKKVEKKHMNQSCIELKSTDPIQQFKVEDVEKCFEKVNQQEQAEALVTFTGTRLEFILTVRYSSKTERYTVANQEIEFTEPPKAECKSVPEGDEEVIKACKCLSKSKVFHSFPRMMANDLLSCNVAKEVEEVDPPIDINFKKLSCQDTYLSILAERD